MMHIHIHIHARKGTGIADAVAGADPGTALAGWQRPSGSGVGGCDRIR